MAKAKGPKPVRIALAYDSYSVEGDTDKALELHFDAPHVARLAFTQHLAKATKQKRLAVTDTTRRLDDFPTAQLEFSGDLVTRAWFTADQLDAEHSSVIRGGGEPRGLRRASEQLAAALALPAFANVHEIGIGLERWNDSHKVAFDDALAVLADKRPPLRALSFGDYDNRSGHVMRFASPARIAELYPALEKLRITTTSAVSGGAFPQLQSLALRTNNVTETMSWAFELPALRHLAISVDYDLLNALVKSPLLPRLESLALLDIRDDKARKLLRRTLDAFKHLELRLDEHERIAGLEDLRVAVVPSIDRYRDSRE